MGSRTGSRVPDRRRSIAGAAFLTLLAGARSGHGAEPGYEVSVGVAETDNVARTATDAKTDTIITEGLDFTWHDIRPRLEADIDADLNYLQYIPHTFGNQVLGNFIGQARFAALPDVLFWNVSDNFGQNRVDPLAAITPDNRENINYFSTGPQVMLPLGDTTFLQMTANYGNVKYQVSPLDSQREDAGIALLRKLSQTSFISFNVRDEHVGYSDDVANVNYNRQDAFVRYDSQGSRTKIGIDLGYSKLHDDIGPVSNVLARVEVSRNVSAFSSVTLSLGHEYLDSADAFRLSQTLGGGNNINTQSAVQSGAPFTTNHAQAAWNFQRSRTGFGISIEYYKDAYQQPSTLDDNRLQGEVYASRRLTPNLEVSLTESYFHQSFLDIAGAAATETTSEAQLVWRAGRRLSMIVDFSRSTRRSDIAATNFTENRGWVRVAWGRPAQRPTRPVAPPLPGEAFR